MRTTITVLISFLLASGASAQDGEDAAEATAETAAAAETIESAPLAIEDFGREPVDCITASRIDHTRVIDERTVLFYMRGGQIYRNRLAYDCPQLVRERRFSYELRTSQLCSVDSITVLEYWGSTLREGVSCGLGQFYPITAEEAEFLSVEPDEMLDNEAAVEETAESPGTTEDAESSEE